MNRSIKILLVITFVSLRSTLIPAQAANSTSSSSSLDPAHISFQEIASGLTRPVFITNAGDGSGRIFIVEQAGRIRIQKNGSVLATPFLDIHTIVKSTSSEQGLFALAFDPSYAASGNFYVAYTAPKNGDETGSNLVLEKFSTSTTDPDLADPGSGVILLTISHPTNSNHNGGTLAFGQDGYLYWSTGDGGSGGDPQNNAQNLNSYLGKILRLDVNSGSPYSIPASNPFYNNPNTTIRQEIWVYGLRNPWRFSFDQLTNDLYIGDVGQGSREEINFQAAASNGGENYGWRIMEGSLCFNPSSGCNITGKVLPVTEYNHSVGCSVTGGYVYRGMNYPALQGYYFYADFCTGKLFSLYKDINSNWIAAQIADLPYNISTFGEDEQGNLYLADFSNGKIYQIQYQGVNVTSIARADPNPSNASSLNFTVIFSESVTGVDASDFTLTTTGVSGATITGISGADPGTTYTATVSIGTGDGTIRLDITDDDTIVNANSNPLGGKGLGNGNFIGGETYTIDRTAPTVLSISRVNGNPTSATNVNFLTTFSESMTGVDNNDFNLTTGGVSGAAVSGASGLGSVYTVTVNTGMDDGTIQLEVPTSATMTDLAGNPLVGLPFTSGDTYIVNKPPRATTLAAPIGDIGTNYNPNYTWNKVATATYYRLYVSGPSGVVLDQWYESANICDATTCTVASPTPLGGGAYVWYVQTYNPIGYGPWSNNTQPTNFSTTIVPPPGPTVLTVPIGNIGINYNPNYTWNKVSTATWYRLYVSGPKGVILDQWYQAVNICNTTTCSVASPTLLGGAHAWYVQTYNSAGYGSWSNNTQPTNFSTTPIPLPGVAVQTAPIGNITTNYNPTYTWNKATDAVYYRLYVSGPSGVVLDQWYLAVNICNAATCSMASPTPLGGGAHAWYVQTWNTTGYGPWSNNTQPTNFSTTIPTIPLGATLTAPSGTITNHTPAYTWNRVNTATWYRLYVSGPGGVIKDQWYQAVSICNATTCSVASPSLPSGAHIWYVQAYNVAGYSPWASSTFNVNP